MSSVVSKRRYKIAVSYPGEYLPIVRKVVDSLQLYFMKSDIFYDKDNQAVMLENNSDLALQHIYNQDSDLILLFYGEKNMDKDWCRVEYEAIRALLNSDPKNIRRVIFIKCDNGRLDGFYEENHFFIDARKDGPDEIATCVRDCYRNVFSSENNYKYSILVYDDNREQVQTLKEELNKVFKDESRYQVDIVYTISHTDLFKLNSEKDFDVYLLDIAVRSSEKPLNDLYGLHSKNMYQRLVDEKPNNQIKAKPFILSRLPIEALIDVIRGSEGINFIDFNRKGIISNVVMAGRIKDYLDLCYLNEM